jgi:hypothetical protein
MADQKASRSTMPECCSGNMKEMMRNMMTKKGESSCCPCSETMRTVMSECCSDQKESPAEAEGQDAPK